jgi:hypothetical protein
MDMRAARVAVVLVVVWLLAITVSAATDPGQDKPQLYTREDLDRMFGPAPAGPSDPVDKGALPDWGTIEQFLDRQYARVDADRQYEFNTHAIDIAAERTPRAGAYYGGYAAYGLGYPASTWWNHVWSQYRTAPYATYHGPHGGGYPYRSVGGMGSRGGGGHAAAHASGRR